MMRALALFLLICFTQGSLAAEPRTEHTFQLSEGESHPDVPVEALAWLSGRWTGTGLGEGFEASWNPPSAGSMVGTFKLFNEGGIEFYELLVLSRVDGVLSLKVKHFSDEFVAWEEKDKFVDFRIVRVDKDAAHFGGISFYRRGADEMDVYIVFRNDAGYREVKLDYQRVE